MRLSLFVVDFHLEEAALDGEAVRRLPMLPALEALLAQGRRLAPQPDWRAALLAEVGLPASPPPSPARVAARVLGLPEGAWPWLAQPVHRVAGLSRLNLHPAGLLRLTAEEAALWSGDFNRDFIATQLRLHPLAPGLVLTGLPDGAQGAGDPARWLGAPLESARAGGDAERALRMAGSEIEMWLHDHPRNRLRERRGELPVNGLWLWGGQGGELPARVPAAVPRGFGEDVFLHGLWHAFGAPVAAARRFAELPAGIDAAILVQSAAALSPHDLPLQRLEADWFAPLRDAVARRELRPLRLWLGGRGWEVAPSWLLRHRWRRPRAWWREVAS